MIFHFSTAFIVLVVTTVKLLPYDLKITNSSHKNNFLQCKVRLRTINLFLGPYISWNFVYRAALNTIFIVYIAEEMDRDLDSLPFNYL